MSELIPPPATAATELAILQEGVDVDLREKVGERFRLMMERSLHIRKTAANAVLDGIVKKHGYPNLALFQQAFNTMLARRTLERSMTFELRHTSPELQKIQDRLETIMRDFDIALLAMDTLHHGTMQEMWHYAVSVEDNLRRAEKAGQIDELTGFTNRRDAVTKQFEIERQHFLDQGGPDEVMIWVEIDLDNFKSLNTKLGHTEVDRVILKELAKRLKTGVRTGDVLCRLGGDEFSIILNRVKKDEVETVMNKIQDLIRRESFPTNEEEIKLTASIGALVIERPQAQNINTTSTDEFMGQVRKKADVAAEYVKKRLGKNAWTIYSPELQTFEKSEEVYIMDFLSANDRMIQDLRVNGLHTRADQIEANLKEIAKSTYQALQEQQAA